MKWLILILILEIVLIAGCTQQIESITIPKTEAEITTCPFEDEIKEAIQEEIYWLKQQEQAGKFFRWTIELEIQNATLFNRSEIDRFNLKCEKGSEEGQNINYLYCKYDLLYENAVIQQTIMSPEGVIEQKIKHEILVPIVVDTTTNYTVVELKCQEIS